MTYSSSKEEALEIVSEVRCVPKIYDLFEDNPLAEIFVIAGGRGKGATWGIGQELIIDSIKEEHFIICTREIKLSIDHSSRRTIERLIRRMGLQDFFIFNKTETVCRITGSIFIYTGLSKITEDNVQGMEGLTRGWIAEGHKILLSSWQKFEPTMRENKAKIYIDYNIQDPSTAVHNLFTQDPTKYPFIGKVDMPELAYLFLDYRDNKFCPKKTLKVCERNRKQYSKQDWEWIWLGKLKDSTDRYVSDELIVREAMKRTVKPDMDEPMICGCDIARMGGDEIVFYKKRGKKIFPGRWMTKKKTPPICDELESYINHDKSVILVIDSGYIGAAVGDEMEKRGYFVELVDFGGTKRMHFDPEHCKECATDMAFNFNDMLPELDLPDDEIMCKQVSQRKWDFTDGVKGIRKIESKKEFKKHAVGLEEHKSPDRGDAIWLSCYNKVKVRIPKGIGNVLRAWN